MTTQQRTRIVRQLKSFEAKRVSECADWHGRPAQYDRRIAKLKAKLRA